MEASWKKAEFLEAVCTRLFPEGWQVVWSRAEDAGRGPLRESFDLVTARAVAPLPVLAEFCLPLVRVGGRFLALKGPDGERELEDGARAIEVLGGRPEKTIRVVLPRDAGERSSHQKTGITPAKYLPPHPAEKTLVLREEELPEKNLPTVALGMGQEEDSS